MWNWVWGIVIFILALAFIEETLNFIWSRKVRQKGEQDAD